MGGKRLTYKQKEEIAERLSNGDAEGTIAEDMNISRASVFREKQKMRQPIKADENNNSLIKYIQVDYQDNTMVIMTEKEIMRYCISKLEGEIK